MESEFSVRLHWDLGFGLRSGSSFPSLAVSPRASDICNKALYHG